MFRAIILQVWYSLSGSKIEEELKLRWDFMWFASFDVFESAPDETSICRFRNCLVKQGLDVFLFA